MRTEALALAAQGDEVHVLAPRPMRDAALSTHAFGGDSLFAWPGAVARASERLVRLGALAPASLRAWRFLRGAPRFDRASLHFLVPVALPCALMLDGCDDIEAVAHGADVRLLLRAPRAARVRALRALLDRARIRFVAHRLLDELGAALDPATRARLEERAVVRAAEIDVPRDAGRARPPAAPDAYAVWVGRDVPEKRLDVALDAARLAGVELVVVGASAPRGGARGSVTFLGPVPRAEALAWIAGARVLVSTSAAEAAPTAVREARALGVPVVACDAGDLARWALADPGIEMTKRDPEGVALAIRKLMRAPGASGAD